MQSEKPDGSEGEARTVIDPRDKREARRRARFEEFCASQERALAETERMVDVLRPLIEQWLESEKKERAFRPRGPACEAPHCRDTITTLHRIPGAAPEDPQALIAVAGDASGAAGGDEQRPYLLREGAADRLEGHGQHRQGVFTASPACR